MKVYVHQGMGHYVGSCIVAIAADYAEAKELIRAMLDAEGLKLEEVNIEEYETDKARCIVSINGDY